jgi:hypothetical protein
VTRAPSSLTAPARSAALAWLGACVLLVLLAGSGLAIDRAGVPPATRIESVERSVARVAPVATARCPQPATLRATNERPRPLPRTRSVCTRGLPPPRAPTA